MTVYGRSPVKNLVYGPEVSVPQDSTVIELPSLLKEMMVQGSEAAVLLQHFTAIGV